MTILDATPTTTHIDDGLVDYGLYDADEHYYEPTDALDAAICLASSSASSAGPISRAARPW